MSLFKHLFAFVVLVAIFSPSFATATSYSLDTPPSTSGNSSYETSRANLRASYEAEGEALRQFQNSQNTNSQANRYLDGQGYSPSSANATEALGGAAGTCAFGSMLTELLQSLINYLLESLFESASEEVTTGLVRVPIQTDLGTSNAQKALRAKEACAWAPWGFCILPSLDHIAYCFVNEIIHYIAQSTIQWIKSGFQGSPAFIEDPEQFFTDAVDSIAGGLLNDISDGLLCEPWRAQVQLRLLNEHVGSFRNSARGCKLSQVSDRWEQFVESGDYFSWDLQYAYTQNPFNNPLGSYIEARNELNRRVSMTEEGLKVQLGWSDGFLHVKDPETGRITTPGRLLESQINRRLGNAENRLLIADEFDEIVNTLVNELIKMALSELLSDDQDSGGSSGGGGGAPRPRGTNMRVTCSVEGSIILPGAGNRVATSTAFVTGNVGTTTFAWSGAFSGNQSFATATFSTAGTYNGIVEVRDQDIDREVETVTCPSVTVR